MKGPVQKDDGPLPPFRSWRPGKLIKPGYSHRRAIVLGLLGLLVLAVLIGSVIILTLRRGRQTRPAATTEVPDTSAAGTRTVCYTVQPGEVMTRLLSRTSIEDSVATEVISALRDAGFNFRRMKPGDSLQLEYRGGRLTRLLYRKAAERVYRVDLTGDEPRVSMLLLGIRRVSMVLTGSIASSLYESVLNLGESPALISEFADILGWEIDFFCETQENDSFTFLFEQKFLDSSPVGYGDIHFARYWGQVGDFSAFRFIDPDGHTDYYNDSAQSMRKTFLKSPLHFSRITSYFGRRRHPIRRIRCQHNGVDYAAPRGTPVSCVADGHVVFAGQRGAFGKLVEVRHPNGIATLYGHLGRFGRGVKSGASVVQNQTIGYVGSTGMSTGPHLHYEIRRLGSAINPRRLDPPRAEPVKAEYLDLFRERRDSLAAVVATNRT
ncbi:MAG: M23 family metallopeptidase [candidate division WOR-3 bacterium]|nr:MAG: M23 family metallopeptidase [candidate division WOR-3 bacterium]